VPCTFICHSSGALFIWGLLDWCRQVSVAFSVTTNQTFRLRLLDSPSDFGYFLWYASIIPGPSKSSGLIH
jgi:hypothetical protein